MPDCKCVGKHVPLPVLMEEVEVGGDKINLCPTTKFNYNLLLDIYRTIGGKPSGAVRKHYSKYVQDLVEKEFNYVSHP